MPDENTNWRDKAACRNTDIDFFDFPTLRHKAEAKKKCAGCPVRRECLKDALDNEDRFGMWGGVEEREIRRALSINQFGNPVRTTKAMHCPDCRSTDIKTREKRRARTFVSCNNCDLEWWTRRVPIKRQKTAETK